MPERTKKPSAAEKKPKPKGKGCSASGVAVKSPKKGATDEPVEVRTHENKGVLDSRRELRDRAFAEYLRMYREEGKTSCRVVAAAVGATHSQVRNWSEKFRWSEEARRLDAVASAGFQAEHVTELRRLKNMMLEGCQSAVKRAVEAIKSGKLKIGSMTEFRQIADVALTLLGEAPAPSVLVQVDARQYPAEVQDQIRELGKLMLSAPSKPSAGAEPEGGPVVEVVSEEVDGGTVH